MLTVRESMALQLEGKHWVHSGARINAIRHELGWSEVRHAVVVSSLLKRSDAEAEAPALVRRLRRLESARRTQRRSA